MRAEPTYLVGGSDTTMFAPQWKLLEQRASSMLEIAVTLSKRSTCSRAAVGACVTDPEMLQILGIGYNGNARGLDNDCDRPTAGSCGCVHAELNALLKAPGLVAKRLFTTHAPCINCAKAILNGGVISVAYIVRYRDPAGVELLRQQMGDNVVQFSPDPLVTVNEELRNTNMQSALRAALHELDSSEGLYCTDQPLPGLLTEGPNANAFRVDHTELRGQLLKALE